MQTRLGFVDVETSPAHFHVSRETPFFKDSIIPWESARINIDETMNLTTGVFTAPQNGVYRFIFSGMQNDYKATNQSRPNIELRLNGKGVESVGSAMWEDLSTN